VKRIEYVTKLRWREEEEDETKGWARGKKNKEDKGEKRWVGKSNVVEEKKRTGTELSSGKGMGEKK
jgi:hypothetical protein